MVHCGSASHILNVAVPEIEGPRESVKFGNVHHEHYCLNAIYYRLSHNFSISVYVLNSITISTFCVLLASIIYLNN